MFFLFILFQQGVKLYLAPNVFSYWTCPIYMKQQRRFQLKQGKFCKSHHHSIISFIQKFDANDLVTSS